MSASELGYFPDDEDASSEARREPTAPALTSLDSTVVEPVVSVPVAVGGEDDRDVRPTLTYVDYVAGDHHPVWPTTGWALQAAVIAALAALLIGSGVAILLVIA